MPYRVILKYVADNATLALSGLDKVKALGNLKPLKKSPISEIRLALVTMPLFAHFSHSKHAKQRHASRLGKAGYLFCVFGMAVGALCVISVLVFLCPLSMLLQSLFLTKVFPGLHDWIIFLSSIFVLEIGPY